ncbi:MAG: tyrosine-type recombinase/integrase [Armatimonadota bacterium]
MATATLNLRKKLTPQEAMAGAITAFYRRCEAKNLSSHTVEYYRYRFDAFTRFLDSRDMALAPEDVTPADIRDFLADESKRISPLTAQHSYITLRAFYRFLREEGTLSENPMEKVQSVKLCKKVMETFSSEHLEAMLKATGQDFAGARMRALLLVLADCGLRVSELCGLKLEDIAWDTQSLFVLGKGNKERLVPFGKVTRQALQEYLTRRGDIDGTDAVFVTCYGDPLTRQRVHRLLTDAGEDAELAAGLVTPHNFRRFFAVQFIRNGADPFTLQKILGHTDLTMTRRYCELAQTDVQKKHRAYSPGDRFFDAVRPAGGRKRIR